MQEKNVSLKAASYNQVLIVRGRGVSKRKAHPLTLLVLVNPMMTGVGKTNSTVPQCCTKLEKVDQPIYEFCRASPLQKKRKCDPLLEANFIFCTVQPE